MTHNTDKILYSVRELCEALGGVSRTTVHRLFTNGEFDKVKIGSHTFAKVDQVRAFVERQTQVSRAA